MIAIPDELVVEGIARAMCTWLREPQTAELVARTMAESAKSEILTTAEAAELLRTTPKTLLANHAEWQLDKSIAIGADNPRFYRSQIMARLRAKQVKARTTDGAKVTEFPQSNPQQKKAS